MQPDLPVRKPPGPLSGTGNGVIQMTIAPSSQGGRGAGWEVGENCQKPGREVKAGSGPSSPLTSVRLWAIIASTGPTFGPDIPSRNRIADRIAVRPPIEGDAPAIAKLTEEDLVDPAAGLLDQADAFERLGQADVARFRLVDEEIVERDALGESPGVRDQDVIGVPLDVHVIEPPRGGTGERTGVEPKVGAGQLKERRLRLRVIRESSMAPEPSKCS